MAYDSQGSFPLEELSWVRGNVRDSRATIRTPHQNISRPEFARTCVGKTVGWKSSSRKPARWGTFACRMKYKQQWNMVSKGIFGTAPGEVLLAKCSLLFQVLGNANGSNPSEVANC